VRWLALALLLTSCASQSAHHAQHTLVGRSESTVLACAGTPDHTTKLPDASTILEYRRDVKGAGLSMSVPLIGTVSAAATGDCRALVQISHGRVEAVRYSGDDDGTFGRDGVCEPILRGCSQ
jgi:hypothetical protein